MEAEPVLIVILEHVGAFAVIGFLFSVTHTRTTLVCLLVLGGAVILELLRLVVPDRDARVIDAVEMLIGGGVGIIAAKIMRQLIFRDSEVEPAPGMENEIGSKCRCPCFGSSIGAGDKRGVSEYAGVPERLHVGQTVEPAGI